ncbi:MAG: hypothetical protein R2867_46325 [Caldilineaceae bacterium]
MPLALSLGKHRASEDIGWFCNALGGSRYNNGESIDNQDLVLWYKAYLGHSAAEGPDLWHSTGVRLAVDSGSQPPTATAVPATPTAVPPTATSIPSTNTPVPLTVTAVPPTATALAPTETPLPPTATAVPPTNTPLPPTATATPNSPTCSTGGGESAYVRFVNMTWRSVDIYWVDYDCNEHFYKRLRAGRYYWQQTYDNHMWRVYDSSGSLSTEVIVTERTQTVYIR